MSDSGLRPEDVVTVAGFLGIVIIGLLWDAVRHSRDNSPQAKVRRRALEMTEGNRPVETLDDSAKATPQAANANPSRIATAIRDLMDMLTRKGGPLGPVFLAAAVVLPAMLAAAAIFSLKLSSWWLLAAVPAAALGGGAFCRSIIVSHYRQRFLGQFPDALDMLIRAVNAGVPVIQSIQMAGEEMPAPLGKEFSRMSNALRLGMEQQDVLDAAARQIDIPDFRFFVVCLQLQRETGGPLSETLENLASVIRIRRDTRLKTRALTAQGRAASKAISAIPLGLVGMLQMSNSNYLEILYSTEKGQQLLWIAGILVVLGMGVINLMTRMEA